MSDDQTQQQSPEVMSFDEIEQAEGVEYDSVPAWGGHIGLMSITAGEAIEFFDAQSEPAKRDAGLLLIARSLVGRDRKRLCQGKEQEERMVTALRGKDSGTCNRIVERILKLNRIDVKSQEAVKNG